MVDSIKIFLEKSNELEQSSFYHFIQTNKIKTSVNWSNENGQTINTNHPSDESIKAFLITLRLFVKPNEVCSFDKIEKALIKLKAPENILTNFINSRENIKEFLEETDVIYNGKTITNKMIFDHFINGKYFHTDKNKREVLDYWKKDESGYMFRFGSFCGILSNYMRLIKHISVLIKSLNNDCA